MLQKKNDQIKQLRHSLSKFIDIIIMIIPQLPLYCIKNTKTIIMIISVYLLKNIPIIEFYYKMFMFNLDNEYIVLFYYRYEDDASDY